MVGTVAVLDQCLISTFLARALSRFSLRLSNDVASFMSSREVYANNISMVHDRLRCVCCLVVLRYLSCLRALSSCINLN